MCIFQLRYVACTQANKRQYVLYVCMYISVAFNQISIRIIFNINKNSNEVVGKKSNVSGIVLFSGVLCGRRCARLAFVLVRLVVTLIHTYAHIYIFINTYILAMPHTHTRCLCAAYTYYDNVLKCLSMGADLWGNLTDAQNSSINIELNVYLRCKYLCF